jgi:N-acetylmuramoyl-L-alanine amidase
MADTDPFSDQEIIAKTAWAEARGDGNEGMTAVINVIQNRLLSGISWWGNTFRSICLKPYQFSCWNSGDPNLAKLLAVSDDDPQYQAALSIADRAMAGDLPDITGGADSYERIGADAFWAATLTPTKTILHHNFYNTRTLLN